MSKAYISVAKRQRVAERARSRCEYCQTQEAYVGMPFEIEHIIPKVAGGSSEEANLCLACPQCNRRKGSRTSAPDEETGESVPLFNPRQDQWHTHFAWEQNGLYLAGLTPIGRATVAALQMNNPFIVRSRRAWIVAGWHPPRA
jgi:hypothetical protein